MWLVTPELRVSVGLWTCVLELVNDLRITSTVISFGPVVISLWWRLALLGKIDSPSFQGTAEEQ